MAEQTESELRRVRIEKLERLQAMDGVRFRNDFRVSSSIGEAVAAGESLDGPGLDAAAIRASLAGRVMAINSFGKAAFLRIRDRSGLIQAYLRRDTVPSRAFERFELTDIGDIVGITGVLMRTRTGELTLKAEDFFVLSKALRPLPEKWHGMRDPELRQRLRYVDLIVNEESRAVFRTRTQIIRYIRRFLDDRDFLEVETPMMHTVLGGANARPFVTHHNTLDLDLYLRIAPELFLKRLVVGGFERVYEINRNFRNEGMDARHNPEFTMLEFYWAYATYHDLIDLTEELLRGLVQTLLGTTTVSFRGHELDFGKPFVRMPVCEALRERCGATDEILRDPAAARTWALSRGVDAESCDAVKAKYATGGGEPRDHALELGMLVFEHEIEDTLVQPTFLMDFPAAVSPLSRRKDADPGLVDRFELFICGWEVANAFSELNDPQDQEARFRRQIAAKSAGDAEAMEYDADYVRALEYGLPPTAGEGIGIDRLTMLLTGQDNIRDVILFPLLRPET